MAQRKLTNTQRLQLLEWLAADYGGSLIAQWFQERGWPEISPPALTYYRKRYAPKLEQLREERYAAALTTGLAVKAERVQRLKEHADALEAIKWEEAENGRLWNEKAWRETLDDIAKELGHRRQYASGLSVNLTPDDLSELSDDDLEHLKQQIA